MRIVQVILIVTFAINQLAIPVYPGEGYLRPCATGIQLPGHLGDDIFQKHCSAINRELRRLSTADAYHRVGRIFEVHSSFLKANPELTFGKIKQPTVEITSEALNVMGMLASRATSQEDIRVWCSLFCNIPAIRQSWQKYNPSTIWQFLLKNRGNPDVNKLREVYGISLDLPEDEKLPEEKAESLMASLRSLTSLEGVDVVEFTPSQDYKTRRGAVLLKKAEYLDEVRQEIEALISTDSVGELIEQLCRFVTGDAKYKIHTFMPKNCLGFNGKLVLLRENGDIYYKIVFVREGFERSFDARLRETLPYGMKYIPLYTNISLVDYRSDSKATEEMPALQQLLKLANANRGCTTCPYNPVGSIEIMVEKDQVAGRRYYAVDGSSGFQFLNHFNLFTPEESKEAIKDALREMGEDESKIPALAEEKLQECKQLYKGLLIERGFRKEELSDIAINVIPCSIISNAIGQPYCRRHKTDWMSKIPYRPRNMCPSKCAERGAKMAHSIARIISYDEGIPCVELLAGVDLEDGGVLVRFRNIDTGQIKTRRISNQRMSEEEKKDIVYERLIDISSSTPLCIHCAEYFEDFNIKYVEGKNVYVYSQVRPYNYNKGAGDIERQRAQDMAALDMVFQTSRMAYIQLPEASPEKLAGEESVLSRELLEKVMGETDTVASSKKDGTDELSVGALIPSVSKPAKESVLLLKPPFTSNHATVEDILRRVQYFGYEIVGMRVFDGAYFKKYPEKISVLYQEAYQGYISWEFPPTVMYNIGKLYNTPDFEFFFDEPFSEDMVMPAAELLNKGLSEEDITELWNVSRPDISFEELKRRFSIDEIAVEGDWIRLRKKDKELVLSKAFLGDDGESIAWFRNGLCFGLNKVGHARNIFPVKDPRINNGRPTLVMNGYVPSLFRLFKENSGTKTIAIIIRNANNKSATWQESRIGLLGDDNNPRGNNIAGSIRRDAVLGKLPLGIDPSDKRQLNGQKNVAHLSSGPLEAVSEMHSIFDIPIEETSFGRLLIDNGYSCPFIKYLLRDPMVRIYEPRLKKYDSHTIFELTKKKDPQEALEIIKKYFPPLNEDDPDTSASVDFEEFLGLQRQYKTGKLSVEKSSFPESEIAPPKSKVRSFEDAVSESGMNIQELDDEGMEMVENEEIAEVIPGGGTSGRFYGYKVKIPESQKLKLLAPIWKIAGRLFSSVEVKMMYLKYLVKKARRGYIPLAIMGSGNNIGYLGKRVAGYGIYSPNDLYLYAQGEIPRVNPTDKDIRASGAPLDSKKYNLPHGKDADANVEQWLSDNGDMGDIFRNDDGGYTGKPVGHFDIIAKLVLSRRLFELAQRGAKVLHIANGDDVGGMLDPAKAAYLMRKKDVDILTLLIEKNTVYSINKDDKIFGSFRSTDPACFQGEDKEFRVIARKGKIIRSSKLPKGIELKLEGDKLSIIFKGKRLKPGIKGEVEKGGTFVHVLSKGKDMNLDQPLPGDNFSSNQFYIKVNSILRLFDLNLEEYAQISQAGLLEKVKNATNRMTTHVEIKPINVGTKVLPDGNTEINMRPAAQFMRYVGEITGFKQINTEPILVDRDGSMGREGYCAVKDPESVPMNAPVVYAVLGLDNEGNLRAGSKLIVERKRPDGELSGEETVLVPPKEDVWKNEHIRDLYLRITDILTGLIDDVGLRQALLKEILEKIATQLKAKEEGLEIERKFLLFDFPEFLNSYTPARIIQRYLFIEGDTEVRIRQKGTKYFFTIKIGEGISRREIEIPISAETYERLGPLANERVIVKDRYCVPLKDGLTAETDRYYGKLEGLVTLEVELPDEKTTIPSFPEGIGRVIDVTGRPEFSNKNLAQFGIPDISGEGAAGQLSVSGGLARLLGRKDLSSDTTRQEPEPKATEGDKVQDADRTDRRYLKPDADFRIVQFINAAA